MSTYPRPNDDSHAHRDEYGWSKRYRDMDDDLGSIYPELHPDTRSDADFNPGFNNFINVRGYAKPDLDCNPHPIFDRHFHYH